jgi:hypothetical protein
MDEFHVVPPSIRETKTKRQIEAMQAAGQPVIATGLAFLDDIQSTIGRAGRTYVGPSIVDTGYRVGNTRPKHSAGASGFCRFADVDRRSRLPQWRASSIPRPDKFDLGHAPTRNTRVNYSTLIIL